MPVANQIKILATKKRKQAQNNLDKKDAKTSVLSYRNLIKYEYLTGEDLNYKPSAVKEAKFNYSPLKKLLTKDWTKKTKKKGFLKRLKNIKDKNEGQLKAIRCKTYIKPQIGLFAGDVTPEAYLLEMVTKNAMIFPILRRLRT